MIKCFNPYLIERANAKTAVAAVLRFWGENSSVVILILQQSFAVSTIRKRCLKPAISIRLMRKTNGESTKTGADFHGISKISILKLLTEER